MRVIWALRIVFLGSLLCPLRGVPGEGAGPAGEGRAQSVQKFTDLCGFKLTKSEYAKLKLLEKSICTQKVKLTDGNLTGGSLIALWPEEQTVTEGGAKLNVNWLLPESSREQFEKMLAKRKRRTARAMLYLVTIENKLVCSFSSIDGAVFAKNSGSFSVATPAANMVKGKGTGYLVLNIGMDQVSNIVSTKISYRD